MSKAVEEAKAEYGRAHARIKAALEATPADKAKWSPSPSARTPIALVAHAAMGTEGLCGMLQGKAFPFSSMAELDAYCRKMEEEYTTPAQAIALLDKNSADYLVWLDTLSDEQIASTVQFPTGPMPMAFAITFAADHLRAHAAQLEYIQTCYGDYEIRM